ncbi:MAG: hypothetical protein PX634_12230, partial [Microcystis sp. M53600_WE12]|nr:hypothetical protein [Microcystis sp. M53600_WE12]
PHSQPPRPPWSLHHSPLIQGDYGEVSPDEKIFTPTDERGFLPYTPHPTPHTLFQVSRENAVS